MYVECLFEICYHSTWEFQIVKGDHGFGVWDCKRFAKLTPSLGLKYVLAKGVFGFEIRNHLWTLDLSDRNILQYGTIFAQHRKEPWPATSNPLT